VIYTLTGPDKGCENWEESKIGEALLDKTVNECGLLCKANSECAQFNFQGEDCATGEGIKKGACYLFKAGCKEEGNTCWDLYTMGSGAVCPDATGSVPVESECKCGSTDGATCAVGQVCAGTVCQLKTCPASTEATTYKCQCDAIQCEVGGTCNAGACTYPDCTAGSPATVACTCKATGGGTNTDCKVGYTCTDGGAAASTCTPQTCADELGVTTVTSECACGAATCDPPGKCKNQIVKDVCEYPDCPNVDGTVAVAATCQCGQEPAPCAVGKKCKSAVVKWTAAGDQCTA